MTRFPAAGTRTVRLAAALCCLIGGTRLAAAQSPRQVSRLAALARLWGDVKFTYPGLVGAGVIDWDSALVATIPAVESAADSSAFAAALDRMLAALGDPATHIVGSREPAPDTTGLVAGSATVQLGDDGVLLVRANDYYSLTTDSSRQALARAALLLDSARAVVLDLRSAAPLESYGEYQLTAALDPIERRLTARTLVAPGERRRVFSGYPERAFVSSGQYRAGYFTRFGSTLTGAGKRDIPTVVLLNRWSAVSDWTLALDAAGLIDVVLEGTARDVPTPGLRTLEPGEGVTATVRAAELISPTGADARLQADLLVADSTALPRALALARGARPEHPARTALAGTAPWVDERSYAAMELPTAEYRLLGLFRAWSVIRLFYPYRDALSDWDGVLLRMIPSFEAASSPKAYAAAIAAFAAELHDSHAYVAGAAYTDSLIGAGYPPVRVRLIEGKPVITAVYDSSGGARIGDVITAVDGEPAGPRLERYEALISASTPQSLADKAAVAFMSGPIGSPVRLTVESAGHSIRTVRLPRQHADYTTLYHRERSGEVVRILPGNIGYVDLDRLEYADVPAMFERLRNTAEIIFDMRGYPNGTGFAIAPRLGGGGQPAALFATRLVGYESPAPEFGTFIQSVDSLASGTVRYRRPTVMLIDERAESQAEHTGLLLRAANGTRFVGTPTAGADGELAVVRWPGGYTMGFTGQSVRWPDGRPLQRVGLQPDLLVRPTIAGIRRGEDEVLSAAVRLLTRSR